MLSLFRGVPRPSRALTLSLGIRDHTGRTRSRYQLPIVTKRRGVDVIHDPLLNRGTGFTTTERLSLSLRGLLPPRRLTIEEQTERIMERVRGVEEPIRKYEILSALQDRNAELFYYTLSKHMAELTPIVYTPTVGLACQKFSEMFRRSRGMFFTSADKGAMHEMVYNWPEDDVDVIVVTDGGRVLGLGDLGLGAMGISVGKSVLYSAAGGIEPSRMLPVMLDVGTDNDELLSDPWYMGIRERRLRGDAYFELVDEFLEAVRMRWPSVLVQFEDFSSTVAAEVLRRHRHTHLCFNDDIQGTGSMTLGGLLSALQTVHLSDPSVSTDLKDHRIVIAGAGSAGMGVASMIRRWLVVKEGLSVEEASDRFWVVDKDGLITRSRSDVPLAPEHALFARGDGGSIPDGASVEETVRGSKATILLGVSGVPGIFTEGVVRGMAENSPRPVIFPMSNPTSKCEASAENVMAWTGGKAVFASGSPFAPVTLAPSNSDDSSSNNGEIVIHPSQANNIYVFPAIGLASVVCKPKRISEDMFLAAAKELSTLVSHTDRERGLIYPPIDDIREVAIKVAIAVCETAYETGIAGEDRPQGLEDTIREITYKPGYDAIVPHHGGSSARSG